MSYFSQTFDEQIVKLMKCGLVGFMPSDTIYGLSALALNVEAVERIHKIKDRDEGKPFIVLLSDMDQAPKLGLRPKDLMPMQNLWPAPITFVAPATPITPAYLHRGMDSLAIRIPNSDSLREFIARTGPIVSTSANLQGSPSVDNAKEARKIFGEKLDFYVDSGRLRGEASTIVKVESGNFVILRQGSYVFDNLEVGK